MTKREARRIGYVFPGEQLFVYENQRGEVRPITSDDVNAYIQRAARDTVEREGVVGGREGSKSLGELGLMRPPAERRSGSTSRRPRRDRGCA